MERDFLGNEPLIQIGTLAKRTGTNIETIRFYEKIGILAEPPRTETGRRLYDERQVERLSFIRRTRALGFSLDEVRALLALVNSRDVDCSEVKDMATRHLDEVTAKIADLRAMQSALAGLITQCDAGDQSGCPMIPALFREGTAVL
ncbi:MerR family transcriptional regulator [Defluviimonas sp. 20V17]|uniref:Transcriptional regulator n=1 Tax=Allgaiera indica TaxID=765699 RepID=A0AAN5A189_9RHOB|nr:helix-turn-helix domain-containing protein [Allgaiera indica]KDB04709.1 MerR family transcriptional regulator [Defluviimonas sp. 20V17]GHE05925.1 transcriptional regulator [Allgaiera indica]SDX81065.1 MerR family transcriptional regulator, mercuric resistance operon regulatory protein [Allgaiera indica]